MLAAYATLAVLVVLLSLAARALGAGTPQRGGTNKPRLDPVVAAFLGPLAEGHPFGAWRITRVEPPVEPARMTLELRGAGGERVIVDVHARSADSPPGIAETRHLAIYARTSNRG